MKLAIDFQVKTKKDMKKKEEGKAFVGGYVHNKLNDLLSRDAKNEHRTKSKQLEHLLLLAFQFRGYDISHLVDDITHNADLQRMSKLIKKEVTPRG